MIVVVNSNLRKCIFSSIQFGSVFMYCTRGKRQNTLTKKKQKPYSSQLFVFDATTRVSVCRQTRPLQTQLTCISFSPLMFHTASMSLSHTSGPLPTNRRTHTPTKGCHHSNKRKKAKKKKKGAHCEDGRKIEYSETEGVKLLKTDRKSRQMESQRQMVEKDGGCLYPAAATQAKYTDQL